MEENTDQKNFEYGHFLHRASYIILEKPNVSVLKEPVKKIAVKNT